MSSAKWRSFCSCLNVLTNLIDLFLHHWWNANIVILMKFSPLAVKMTISGANDENVIKNENVFLSVIDQYFDNNANDFTNISMN